MAEIVKGANFKEGDYNRVVRLHEHYSRDGHEFSQMYVTLGEYDVVFQTLSSEHPPSSWHMSINDIEGFIEAYAAYKADLARAHALAEPSSYNEMISYRENIQ